MPRRCVIYMPLLLYSHRCVMLCRIISCGVWCRGRVIHIRRGAYALLVSTDRAMRRPQIVKRATVQGFTLFLCLIETKVNRGVALAAYRWAAYGG